MTVAQRAPGRTVLHARLVDDSRYCRESMASFISRPSVGRDGRWRPTQHYKRDGACEYLCDDHPFLGWIPEADLWFHAASASHGGEGHTMGSRWRYAA